jgi:hypothetical protein
MAAVMIGPTTKTTTTTNDMCGKFAYIMFWLKWAIKKLLHCNLFEIK